MAIARVAEPSGSLQDVREWGLDREDLLQIYRNMLITRGVEERGHILYRQGKIPGSFYTGRGNEAASVGVATAMGSQDVGTPLHRDMGVHITRGVEPWRIFAQYMGRADGPTGGKDGNVHMADSRLGLIAMVSHLPAMLPVAVGCALAFRIREERRVALAWFGEGASARGDTHEGMNFAGVFKVPVERLDKSTYNENDVYFDRNGMPDMKALQADVDLAADFGFLKERIDLTKYTDLSIMDEAMKRVGAAK